MLFALQLIDLGAGWTTKTPDLRRDSGLAAQPPLTLAQPAVPVSERLRELQARRDNGAISDMESISDMEHSARRLQIISDL